ncbi:MAG: hypothetical protein RLZZ164_389 [Actinomycetota bacterium]
MFNKAVRLTGELFILAGIVIGLWLIYENYGTNLQAATATANTTAQLEKEWTTQHNLNVQINQPFALVYIPRLGHSAWGLPLLEGTGQANLAKGLGHYTDSQLPGQAGNFAIAGHRVTHGQPFYDFPKLQSGDLVYVKTGEAIYEYKLFATKFVKPSDYYVVSRAPRVALPTDARGFNLLTLTTCDPAWNSYRRWIWWGYLTAIHSLADDPTVGVTP